MSRLISVTTALIFSGAVSYALFYAVTPNEKTYLEQYPQLKKDIEEREKRHGALLRKLEATVEKELSAASPSKN